ncbi:MAG TPA: hypothetical protein VFG09_06520 [Thermodesulfovibrionales bacterium]|jgi:hypothetical protein|nr:hypothetical protein [Thermodesulfovibrionales bacterium]
MARLYRIVALSYLMIFITGAYLHSAAAANKSEIIKPSEIHEDCMELVPGESLYYSFEASGPLNFNIHYHEDHNVVYGITKDEISSDKATFRCEKKQYYCLMWTNPGAGQVSLTYSYSTKEK